MEVNLRYQDDGHVLSITTVEGYLLSLQVQNREPVLLLVSDKSQQLVGPELLKANDSVELVLAAATTTH